MKLTKTNYFKLLLKIGIDNLPQVLKEAHSFVMEATDNANNFNAYKTDSNLKRIVNLVFEKMQELMKLGKNYMTPKDAALQLLRPYALQRSSSEIMENLSADEEDFSAYVKGDKVFVTKLYGTSINETFKVSELIRDLKIEDSMGDEARENIIKRVNKMRKAYKHKQPEFKILRVIIAWDGRLIYKSMIKNFLAEIKKHREDGQLTEDSPVIKEIDLLEKKLDTVIKSMGDSITIKLTSDNRALFNKALKKVTDPGKGKSLNGIEPSPAPEQPKIMSSTDVANMEFKTIGFTGKWLLFIGDPCPGFRASVSGMPKMGKSFLCVEFADYLAKNFGKTLYVTKEEFMSPTFNIKLKQKNVSSPNLDVAGSVPEDLSAYLSIFVDSVTSLKLSPDQLKEMEQKNPGKNFIYVHQVTKDGKARGSNEHIHNVDIVITVPERGKAVQYGRFNQGGTLDIFQEPDQPEEQQKSGEIKSEPYQPIDGLAGPSKIHELPREFYDTFICYHPKNKKREVLMLTSFLQSVKDETNLGTKTDELLNLIGEAKDGTEDFDNILKNEIYPLMNSIAPKGTEFSLKLGQKEEYGFWKIGDDDLEGVNSSKRDIVSVLVTFSIPLEILKALLRKNEEPSDLFPLLEQKDKRVIQFVEKEIKDILKSEKSPVKAFDVDFDEVDSTNFSHGMAYFKVYLYGQKADVKKVAGDDKVFFYDWENFAANPSKERKRNNRKENKFDPSQYDERPDNENPTYIFHSTSTKLLCEALNKDFDIFYMVRLELANRGVDRNGLWVGFPEAKRIHQIE